MMYTSGLLGDGGGELGLGGGGLGGGELGGGGGEGGCEGGRLPTHSILTTELVATLPLGCADTMKRPGGLEGNSWQPVGKLVLEIGHDGHTSVSLSPSAVAAASQLATVSMSMWPFCSQLSPAPVMKNSCHGGGGLGDGGLPGLALGGGGEGGGEGGEPGGGGEGLLARMHRLVM